MGAENPTISRETETQVPAACQPQPWQPHIIKLISQLQKPTRRISDTWIIDTGKRETRYQLVKVHQTIRQPHSILSPGLFFLHLSITWWCSLWFCSGFHLISYPLAGLYLSSVYQLFLSFCLQFWLLLCLHVSISMLVCLGSVKLIMWSVALVISSFKNLPLQIF